MKVERVPAPVDIQITLSQEEARLLTAFLGSLNVPKVASNLGQRTVSADAVHSVTSALYRGLANLV